MGKRIKSNNSSKRKRKDKWLWIIGWILVFPILATIYLNKEYKNKKKDVKYYSLLGTAWAIYLLLVVVIAPAQKKSNQDDSVNRNSVVTEVQQSSIKSIHFQNNNIELKIDDNINDCVIVEYDTDKELSPTDIVFTSGDKSIVTVEFDKIVSEKVYYVIKGISEGKTFLCASSNDGTVKSDEITVVVKNKSIEPKRVTLSYERDEIALGEKIHLNASVEPEEADIGLITWESSDSSVLVIDENGIISAVGGGTAVVLAKINGEIKDEYELKVNENVRKFKVSVGHKRDDNNNIGDEWSYYDSVNDNDLRDINHEIL